MRTNPSYLLILLLVPLSISTIIPLGYATQYSIPINGRFATQVIRIQIPTTPRWAHDVVLNATIAWNHAQAWYNASTTQYTFVENNDGRATATISFEMPKAYAGIAVGWTDYKFAPGSRTVIVGTQTYLDPSVFNQAQESNVTARRIAFWLALHELGRILGLGSVLDGQDIMEPRATPARASEVPKLSTLDLYAIHVLALGNAPPFVTLPDGVQNDRLSVTQFLT